MNRSHFPPMVQRWTAHQLASQFGDVPAALFVWDLNATFGLTFPWALPLIGDGGGGTSGFFLLLVYGFIVYRASLLLANALDGWTYLQTIACTTCHMKGIKKKRNQ